MVNNFPGEEWKVVRFDFAYSNDYTLEVSNYGRLKTYNKVNKGKLLQGSMIKGYRIIRLKFFVAREASTDARFKNMQQQILKLMKDITTTKKLFMAAEVNSEQHLQLKQKLDSSLLLLEHLKKNYRRDSDKDLQKRAIHYHSLIHRLVADYFCNKPSDKYTVVAHSDFDKMNNRSINLKWMTPEENFVHQQKSPLVIQTKANRAEIYKYNPDSKVNKLTVTKVMLLKKLLLQGKPMKTLVKQFKITETQILRIKRGENWKEIQPAP
jgi:hypothetical protein